MIYPKFGAVDPRASTRHRPYYALPITQNFCVMWNRLGSGTSV